MKNRRSVDAEPYAQKKMKAITGRGGRKDDTCDHGLYVQMLESRSVQKKKITGRGDQSAPAAAARSTSSTKQHNLFVSYVPTRPLALDRQTTTATESGTTATTKHAIHTHFSEESSRGKKTPKNAIRGRMHATTGFFRGYCLLATMCGAA